MFLRCHCEEGVSLTRQSSGTIGQPTASPRQSHITIPTGLPRPARLAMTAWGVYSKTETSHPTSPTTPPRCHCEKRSNAAIQRRRGQPPHRSGIPHDASDWIATSVLFETFLAMTKSEEI
jgi:hypothetical protein